MFLAHIGFFVKNPGKWVVLDVLFLEDGCSVLTRFVVDERLTFCLGLIRIARNFLVFVRALYRLGTSLISAVNQLNEVYKRTGVPVGLYSYF